MRPEDILIVNDGSPFLQTIGLILAEKGHRTCVTDSPLEALAELARKYFRLVIVKLQGKTAASPALLNAVKDLNPEAALIILGEDARLPVEAFQLAVDDYILLPCRPVEVWRRITSCLKALRDAAPEAVRGKLNASDGWGLTRLSLLFHDLRSGLVSQQAALKLARRRAQEQLDAEVDRLLEDAGKKADWLQALLEEFLRPAFRSPESDAEPDICHIREDVVTPVLDELWDDLQKHGVALENHLDFLPSHLGTVKGDKVALRSVFRNLINNAIQYGGKGCSLKIDYDRLEPFFRLQVFNSGAVPPQETGCILSPGLPPGKGKGNGGGRGLGLGLRLSQEILQSYGGDIRYEPQPGGTKVQVFLAMS
ncbi:MAG: hybrid sensor histidine kinase/response regulator [Deltaproteobacteria bacterium]|nr:MAG: hybrid sensor histidine kinase/response regulator [Deltaproteobacteria bacterium]